MTAKVALPLGIWLAVDPAAESWINRVRRSTGRGIDPNTATTALLGLIERNQIKAAQAADNRRQSSG
jgi:hypothetical protein